MIEIVELMGADQVTPVRVKVMGMVKLAVQFPSQKVVREGCIAWSSLIRRCVHVCVCVCVRACVRVCVHTHLCVCKHACVCDCVQCPSGVPGSHAESGDRHSVSSPGQVPSTSGRHFPLPDGGEQVCMHNSPWHTLCSQFTLTHIVLTIHPDTHCAHNSP